MPGCPPRRVEAAPPCFPQGVANLLGVSSRSAPSLHGQSAAEVKDMWALPVCWWLGWQVLGREEQVQAGAWGGSQEGDLAPSRLKCRGAQSRPRDLWELHWACVPGLAVCPGTLSSRVWLLFASSMWWCCDCRPGHPATPHTGHRLSCPWADLASPRGRQISKNQANHREFYFLTCNNIKWQR